MVTSVLDVNNPEFTTINPIAVGEIITLEFKAEAKWYNHQAQGRLMIIDWNEFMWVPHIEQQLESIHYYLEGQLWLYPSLG